MKNLFVELGIVPSILLVIMSAIITVAPLAIWRIAASIAKKLDTAEKQRKKILEYLDYVSGALAQGE